jgi:signal transduction histidine kinase
MAKRASPKGKGTSSNGRRRRPPARGGEGKTAATRNAGSKAKPATRKKAPPVRAKATSSRPKAPRPKRPRRKAPYRRRENLDQVMAAFAHDVRTPLTGILTVGDLLATAGLGERERRWIAAMKDAAEHLAELTTLIVEGTRAASGRLPLRTQTFDALPPRSSRR